MNAQRQVPTRAMMAKLHIAKKQLGLDDETYRSALERITGQRSARDCTERQIGDVLKHFAGAGFKPVRKGAFTGPAAPMARKIHALWLSGWNLGAIEDQSLMAMDHFIQRQTGIAKAQWLQNSADAEKVIEALKAWLGRAAHVQWTELGADGRSRRLRPQDAVVTAQLRVLASLGGRPAKTLASTPLEAQRVLGREIRRLLRERDVTKPTGGENAADH